MVDSRRKRIANSYITAAWLGWSNQRTTADIGAPKVSSFLVCDLWLDFVSTLCRCSCTQPPHKNVSLGWNRLQAIASPLTLRLRVPPLADGEKEGVRGCNCRHSSLPTGRRNITIKRTCFPCRCWHVVLAALRQLSDLGEPATLSIQVVDTHWEIIQVDHQVPEPRKAFDPW